MAINKKRILDDNKKDWADFTLGYLDLAKLGLLELENKKYNEEDEDSFTVQRIFIPSLYNLRHSIEMFLKLFSMEFLNREFLDGQYHTHDIEQLFVVLKKEVGDRRLNDAISKYNIKFLDDKEELKGKNIFKELEEIVLKYYNLTPLKEKIGVNYSIRDVDNTALRYPINNLEINLHYHEITKGISEVDVLKILTDCEKLGKIFWQLYLIIYVERDVFKKVS